MKHTDAFVEIQSKSIFKKILKTTKKKKIKTLLVRLLFFF